MMKCKCNFYKSYYQNKVTDQKFITNDYFLYILSLYDCRSHRITRIRKHISYTLKGFIDCLLLTNQIDITDHKNYMIIINSYVNYDKEKGDKTL